MVQVLIAKERADEPRVAATPETVKAMLALGLDVELERGAGAGSFIGDASFEAAGAKLVEPGSRWGAADLVLRVRGPEAASEPGLGELRAGASLIGFITPHKHLELVKFYAENNISCFAMELVPRITRAQKMDALSSQANIAGYKAVLIAAAELPKYFPMFMTAAGTVYAAKVFVIGAGVAGLQAIATAKRLGAAVTATDTRKAVAEQIHSLGAKFVGVESAEDAQTATGYAKELSQEFYRKQAELIAQQCAANDVVITTALIGGTTAPKLITEDMVRSMKPGSVIVDLAATAGGNCTLTEPGETVLHYGVKICAPLNLPSSMPQHASLLFGRNLTHFVLAFWNEKEKRFNLDLEDEIIRGALVTHDGQVLHGPTRAALEKSGP